VSRCFWICEETCWLRCYTQQLVGSGCVMIAPSRDLEMLRRHRSRSTENRPRTAPPTHNGLIGMCCLASVCIVLLQLLHTCWGVVMLRVSCHYFLSEAVCQNAMYSPFFRFASVVLLQLGTKYSVLGAIFWISHITNPLFSAIWATLCGLCHLISWPSVFGGDIHIIFVFCMLNCFGLLSCIKLCILLVFFYLLVF